MLTLEPHLYIDLGSDYTGWKDITADVLIDNPVRWVQGITSNDPRDRIANTGQFIIELDNSSDNSAGVASYYSPGHSDCMAGFDIGRRIRWQYETRECQDPAYIIASDTPATDLYNTDTQLNYGIGVAKTDNSFRDGLYYPVFTSDNIASATSDDSAIVTTVDWDNFSVAFWFKVNNIAGQAAGTADPLRFTIYAKSSDETTSALDLRHGVVASGGELKVRSARIHTHGGVTSDAAYLDGSTDFLITDSDRWYHYAATTNSTDMEMRIYLDGEYVGAYAITADYLVMGTINRYACTTVGSGSLAHVAVWNTVLTSDEIFGLSQLGEFAFDATIGIARQAPKIYYAMGAKESHAAAAHVEQNQAIRYTYAQLEAGYKPAMPRYAFAGRIANIDVPVGRFGERKVVIEAVDWMDDASNVLVSEVPTMVNYTADQILSMFLLYSGVNPTTYNFDVGQTLSYAWGSSKGNETLYSEMKRLAQSEPGYIYLRGCAASDGEVGTVLQFEGKSMRFEKTTTDAAFGDDVASDAPYDIRTARSLDRLVNGVEVTVHPVEIDAVAVPVYSMSSDLTPTIPAYGELVFTAKYVDTDEAYELIGATEITQPVRNVDYTINSAATGLGNDKSEDMRAVVAGIESANLIQYLIGYEQNGYVLANYIKPSVPATTSVPVNTTGGTTTVTTIGTVVSPYNPPKLAT